MPPMMGMIGSLVGAAGVGWGVHLVFSAIIGAIFGFALGSRVTSWATGAGLGAAYGFLWWILGPLLIMPTWMGMRPMLAQAFDASNLMSLVGHLVYGMVDVRRRCPEHGTDDALTGSAECSANYHFS
jgi:uncharacterized membrane protein YagU involved in acid resistance